MKTTNKTVWTTDNDRPLLSTSDFATFDVIPAGVSLPELVQLLAACKDAVNRAQSPEKGEYNPEG